MPLVFSPQSQCVGKRRYPDKRTAKTVNRISVAHGGDPLKPYRCIHCGGWHLGHHVRGAYETENRKETA